MALTVNTNIINDTDQYLLDAKNVKGTYVVVDTVAERDNLPAATTVEGSLCYVTGTKVFYQYNEGSWKESCLATNTTVEAVVDAAVAAVEEKIPIVDYPVTSVNGKTGAVSLNYTDVGAMQAGADIEWSKVTNTPASLAGYGISNAYTKGEVDASIAAVNEKIPIVNYPVTSVNTKTGAVSLTATDVGAVPAETYNTELNKKVDKETGKGLSTNDFTDTYKEQLDGLSSALANKQATITGAATTIVSDDLAAGKALVSDTSGKVNVSPVTSTELGYLSGVTSNIQTQLNGKSKVESSTTNGSIKIDGTDTQVYTLPTASSDVLGGVKVGAGLSITDGVLSANGGGTADAVEWTNVLNTPTTIKDYGLSADAYTKSEVNATVAAVEEKIPEVVNNLESTSTTNALSAAQGNALNVALDAHAKTATHITSDERIKWDAAQANSIESITVNGTAITPDANKAVNISVPTGALASKNTVSEADLDTALTNKLNGMTDAGELTSAINAERALINIELDKKVNKTDYEADKLTFATKSELGPVSQAASNAETKANSLESRLNDIVATGGEPNTINTIKVNGTALQVDAQKAVDIEVPSGALASKSIISESDLDAPLASKLNDKYTKEELDAVVAEQNSKIENAKLEASNNDIVILAETQREIANAQSAVTSYIDAQLSDYAKTDEVTADLAALENMVPVNVSQLTNDSGYITLADVPAPNLEEYAKKADLPDVSKFITEVPSEYITETELTAELAAKGYLTEHQSLEGYAKTDDIPTTLADLTDDAEHRTVTDTEKETWNNKSEVKSYNDLIDAPAIEENESGMLEFADESDNIIMRVSKEGLETTNITINGKDWSTKLDKNQGVDNAGKVLLVDSNGDIIAGNPTIEGAVDAAGKLSTARTISLTGDAEGSVSFDGSVDVSIEVTVKDDSHSHSNYQTAAQVTAAIDAALANIVRAETVSF